MNIIMQLIMPVKLYVNGSQMHGRNEKEYSSHGPAIKFIG